jgi:hypothetical protein
MKNDMEGGTLLGGAAGFAFFALNVAGFPEVPIYEVFTVGLAYGGAWGFGGGSALSLYLTPATCFSSQ